MEEKSVEWEGSSRTVVRGFPEGVRQDLGYALMLVQRGEAPSDFKPLRGVGTGVYELRAQDGDAYRVIYIARFEEAVYVLHAFKKKARKGIATPRADLETAAKRLKAVEARRRRG